MDSDQHVLSTPKNKSEKNSEIKIDKQILQLLSGLISKDQQVRNSKAIGIINLISNPQYESVS